MSSNTKIGEPKFRLRVGAKSAAYWDPDREQDVIPTVHPGVSVALGWTETAAGGETQRSLSIPVEEIPHLIGFLAAVLITEGES